MLDKVILLDPNNTVISLKATDYRVFSPAWHICVFLEKNDALLTPVDIYSLAEEIDHISKGNEPCGVLDLICDKKVNEECCKPGSLF
jgi:hypothetical protein